MADSRIDQNATIENASINSDSTGRTFASGKNSSSSFPHGDSNLHEKDLKKRNVSVGNAANPANAEFEQKFNEICNSPATSLGQCVGKIQQLQKLLEESGPDTLTPTEKNSFCEKIAKIVNDGKEIASKEISSSKVSLEETLAKEITVDNNACLAIHFYHGLCKETNSLFSFLEQSISLSGSFESKFGFGSDEKNLTNTLLKYRNECQEEKAKTDARVVDTFEKVFSDLIHYWSNDYLQASDKSEMSKILNCYDEFCKEVMTNDLIGGILDCSDLKAEKYKSLLQNAMTVFSRVSTEYENRGDVSKNINFSKTFNEYASGIKSRINNKIRVCCITNDASQAKAWRDILDELDKNSSAAVYALKPGEYKPINADKTKEKIKEIGDEFKKKASNLEWKDCFDLLGKVPAIKALYDLDAHVNDTVGNHTQMVLRQFKEQSRFFDLDNVQQEMQKIKGFEEFDVNKFMTTLLLLHDIGKGLGSSSAEQHAFTPPIAHDIMLILGFTPKEIKLAETLIGNDILGEYQKFRGVLPGSPVAVAHRVRALADSIDLPGRTFFKMLRALYISDASSYRTIRGYCMTKTDDGKLKFKVSVQTDGASRLENVEEVFNVVDPKALEDSIHSRLEDENFSVTKLFDSSNYGISFNVFKIADYIRQNETALATNPKFKDNQKKIMEMVNFAITLKDDKFKSDYAEYLIRYRLMVREKCDLQRFNGKTMSEAKRSDDMKDLSEKFNGIFREICPTDWTKFMGEYYLTRNATKCEAFKLLTSLQRNVPFGDQVWLYGLGQAYENLENVLGDVPVTEGQALQGFAAYQALCMELMLQLNMPNKVEDKGAFVVRLQPEGTLCGSTPVDSFATGAKAQYRIDKGPFFSLSCTFGKKFSSADEFTNSTAEYGSRVLLIFVPLHRMCGADITNLFLGVSGTLMANLHDLPYANLPTSDISYFNGSKAQSNFDAANLNLNDLNSLFTKENMEYALNSLGLTMNNS
ncbi:MAG: hypothetical protein LBI56_02170 [Puniceicoccales bacterium]|jgi:hypothetical protein|nr:hypothetical protein [Puniceicoccales bacterium]